VQSLERGLAVLGAFDAERTDLTLTEVARATCLARATARRLLHTLVELGYVQQRGRIFALRPKVLELGFAYLAGLTLPEIAEPHLRALTDAVQESASLAVLDGEEIVYVAHVPRHRIMSVDISVGTRFPAHGTSMGRVLLAEQSDERLSAFLSTSSLPLTAAMIANRRQLSVELRQIREQGWAIVDEELGEGLCAVAAPIRDASDQVVAAINVSAPTRIGKSQQLREEVTPYLLRAATRIQHDLIARVLPQRPHRLGLTPFATDSL
jgi:IclR family pca regulon transcriptional regulator